MIAAVVVVAAQIVTGVQQGGPPRDRGARRCRPQIKSLPPGDYLAVAVDYVQDGMWNDPEYLDSIRRHAQRFTLGESDARTVGLRITAVESP
jgi:hypothetical protein